MNRYYEMSFRLARTLSARFEDFERTLPFYNQRVRQAGIH